MQSALLERSESPRLGSLEALPLTWRPGAEPALGTRVAVTVCLSAASSAGSSAAVREVLIWIDLPGDASVRGAGVDLLERQTWTDELSGGEFEHITCQVRHEAATRDFDLIGVLHTLRDQGLIADGDQIASVDVDAYTHEAAGH